MIITREEYLDLIGHALTGEVIRVSSFDTRNAEKIIKIVGKMLVALEDIDENQFAYQIKGRVS